MFQNKQFPVEGKLQLNPAPSNPAQLNPATSGRSLDWDLFVEKKFTGLGPFAMKMIRILVMSLVVFYKLLALTLFESERRLNSCEFADAASLKLPFSTCLHCNSETDLLDSALITEGTPPSPKSRSLTLFFLVIFATILILSYQGLIALAYVMIKLLSFKIYINRPSSLKKISVTTRYQLLTIVLIFITIILYISHFYRSQTFIVKACDLKSWSNLLFLKRGEIADLEQQERLKIVLAHLSSSNSQALEGVSIKMHFDKENVSISDMFISIFLTFFFLFQSISCFYYFFNDYLGFCCIDVSGIMDEPNSEKLLEGLKHSQRVEFDHLIKALKTSLGVNGFRRYLWRMHRMLYLGVQHMINGREFWFLIVSETAYQLKRTNPTPPAIPWNLKKNN